MTQQEEIEDAKINYSAVYRISDEIFTQVACEVLNIPISRVQITRCISIGSEFGKLTVHVYKEDDERKAYYAFDNGAIRYDYLSANINEFKNELKTKSNKIN
jgi:hypothetical protein